MPTTKPFISSYALINLGLSNLSAVRALIQEENRSETKTSILTTRKFPRIPTSDEIQRAFDKAPESFRQVLHVTASYLKILKVVNLQHDQLTNELRLTTETISKSIDQASAPAAEGTQDLAALSDQWANQFKNIKEKLSIMKEVIAKTDTASNGLNELIKEYSSDTGMSAVEFQKAQEKIISDLEKFVTKAHKDLGLRAITEKKEEPIPERPVALPTKEPMKEEIKPNASATG